MCMESNELCFFEAKSRETEIEEMLKDSLSQEGNSKNSPTAIINYKNTLILAYGNGNIVLMDILNKQNSSSSLMTDLDEITHVKLYPETSIYRTKVIFVAVKKEVPYLLMCTINIECNGKPIMSMDEKIPILVKNSTGTSWLQDPQSRKVLWPTGLEINDVGSEILVTLELGALLCISCELADTSQKEHYSEVIYNCEEPLLDVVRGVKEYIYILSAYRVICLNGKSKEVLYDALLPGAYAGSFLSLRNCSSSSYLIKEGYDILISCGDGLLPVGASKGLGCAYKSHGDGKRVMCTYKNHIVVGYPALTEVDKRNKPNSFWEHESVSKYNKDNGKNKHITSEIVLCECNEDLPVIYKHVVHGNTEKLLSTSEGGGRVAPIYYMFEYKNTLYLITSGCMVHSISELNLLNKLKLTLENSNYELALKLMRRELDTGRPLPPVRLFNQGMDKGVLPAVCFHDPVIYVQTKYADHLFDQGKTDEAIDMYLSLKSLNESYVLGKLLSKNMPLLTIKYLEGLIKQDRTSLSIKNLLCTYYVYHSKLKELKKIIKSPGGEEIARRLELNICEIPRATAKQVAHILKNDNMYVELLINVEKNYRAAARFLLDLHRQTLHKVLEQYAEVLLSEAPKETCAVFSELSAKFSPYSCVDLAKNAKGRDSMASSYIWPDTLTIYFKMNSTLVKYIEDVLAMRWGVSISSANALKLSTSKIPPLEKIDKEILERDRKSRSTLCNMLFELYIVLSQPEYKAISPMVGKKYRESVMKLMYAEGVELDWERALFVCERHKFKEGLLFIYEKLKLYDGLLEHYIGKDDVEGVISICSQENGGSGLWIKAIGLSVDFVSKSNFKTGRLVLERVCKGAYAAGVVSVLELSELLTNIPGMNMNYMKNVLTEPINNVVEKLNCEKLKSCRDTNDESLKDISEVCETCGEQFGFPVKVFKCGHASHERCIEKGEDVCKICPFRREVKKQS